MSGSGGGARFSLRELLDSAPAQVGDGFGEDASLEALGRTEYRFPVIGLSPVKLPKDVSALKAVVTGVDGVSARAVLGDPRYRVPLVGENAVRRTALISAVDDATGPAVCVVWLSVELSQRRHEPVRIVECHGRVARGEDAIVELLESVWADADPRVLKPGSGPTAMWLGGDVYRESADAAQQIIAICATYGLAVEIVSDAVRHVGEVRTRMGSSPPELVIVWSGHAQGLEPAVAAFAAASDDGELVTLDEYDFDDALVELRWALQELDVVADDDLAESADVPQHGEERFYIKLRGSAAGDKMIQVRDCGHGQWGSDTKRKAPRAFKGLSATVGARPVALFLCSKCTKHRWRARF